MNEAKVHSNKRAESSVPYSAQKSKKSQAPTMSFSSQQKTEDVSRNN